MTFQSFLSDITGSVSKNPQDQLTLLNENLGAIEKLYLKNSNNLLFSEFFLQCRTLKNEISPLNSTNSGANEVETYWRQYLFILKSWFELSSSFTCGTPTFLPWRQKIKNFFSSFLTFGVYTPKPFDLTETIAEVFFKSFRDEKISWFNRKKKVGELKNSLINFSFDSLKIEESFAFITWAKQFITISEFFRENDIYKERYEQLIKILSSDSSLEKKYKSLTEIISPTTDNVLNYLQEQLLLNLEITYFSDKLKNDLAGERSDSEPCLLREDLTKLISVRRLFFFYKATSSDIKLALNLIKENTNFCGNITQLEHPAFLTSLEEHSQTLEQLLPNKALKLTLIQSISALPTWSKILSHKSYQNEDEKIDTIFKILNKAHEKACLHEPRDIFFSIKSFFKEAYDKFFVKEEPFLSTKFSKTLLQETLKLVSTVRWNLDDRTEKKLFKNLMQFLSLKDFWGIRESLENEVLFLLQKLYENIESGILILQDPNDQLLVLNLFVETGKRHAIEFSSQSQDIILKINLIMKNHNGFIKTQEAKHELKLGWKKPTLAINPEDNKKETEASCFSGFTVILRKLPFLEKSSQEIKKPEETENHAPPTTPLPIVQPIIGVDHDSNTTTGYSFHANNS